MSNPFFSLLKPLRIISKPIHPGLDLEPQTQNRRCSSQLKIQPQNLNIQTVNLKQRTQPHQYPLKTLLWIIKTQTPTLKHLKPGLNVHCEPKGWMTIESYFIYTQKKQPQYTNKIKSKLAHYHQTMLIGLHKKKGKSVFCSQASRQYENVESFEQLTDSDQRWDHKRGSFRMRKTYKRNVKAVRC